MAHAGLAAILLSWLVFGCRFSVFGRRRDNVATVENRTPTTRCATVAQAKRATKAENQFPCPIASCDPWLLRGAGAAPDCTGLSPCTSRQNRTSYVSTSRIIPSFTDWLVHHRNELDAIVFDVDGVLMKARRPVPGSAELVQRLRTDHVPFRLLTNDGCHSPQEKIELLRECGLEFTEDEIVSSSHGMVELAEERSWQDHMFFVMGYVASCYGDEAGIQMTTDVDSLPRCTGVIVGEKSFDWEAVINAVFNYLITHADASLIVPNPDEYFAGRSQPFHIASGAIGRFLRQLCHTHGHRLEPIYLGKPYEPIFLHNHYQLEQELRCALERDRVVIIGDSLASDIKGGRDFGYRTALVLTGITTEAMLADSDVQPELVCRTI